MIQNLLTVAIAKSEARNFSLLSWTIEPKDDGRRTCLGLVSESPMHDFGISYAQGLEDGNRRRHRLIMLFLDRERIAEYCKVVLQGIRDRYGCAIASSCVEMEEIYEVNVAVSS